MTMYIAYFDESGSPDEKSSEFVVAGYISSEEQWEIFEREWREILDENEIRIFHMRQFAHSRGEFSSWKGKEEKRRRFLQRLVITICLRGRKSFSCAVSPKEYQRVNQKYLLHENLGNAYSFCARHCIAKVREWAREYKQDESKICYVFESGTKGKGQLIDIMERDGFPSPNFLDKDCPPLQAADFVSWEQSKVLRQIRDNNLYRFRKSFEELQRMPKEWGIYKQEQLETICKKAGFARRSMSP